jgi:hypothetical protein
LRRKEAQFVDDGIEVLDRIATRCAGNVDEMHEHLRALDVAQELVSESVPFVGALDQPGDVCDDEAAIVAHRHNAEIRRERRERVIGNLRPRGGDP